MDMNFNMSGSTTTTSSSSSSSSSSSNGRVVSSTSTVTKTHNGHTTTTKKGKKTMGNGDVIEYETSGNVSSVEFDPSKMNSGFTMEFNTTGMPPQQSPHTVTTTTTYQHENGHEHHGTVTADAEGAQVVAHAAMMGVANLFAPKPQVVVKETHTVYVPAPTTQIVYKAPPQEEVSDVAWECVGWSEGTHCCCKQMSPEKARIHNAQQAARDKAFNN